MSVDIALMELKRSNTSSEQVLLVKSVLGIRVVLGVRPLCLVVNNNEQVFRIYPSQSRSSWLAVFCMLNTNQEQ